MHRNSFGWIVSLLDLTRLRKKCINAYFTFLIQSCSPPQAEVKKPVMTAMSGGRTWDKSISLSLNDIKQLRLENTLHSPLKSGSPMESLTKKGYLC